MTLVNVEGKMGGGDSMQCCRKTLTYDIKSVLGDRMKCVGMLAVTRGLHKSHFLYTAVI